MKRSKKLFGIGQGELLAEETSKKGIQKLVSRYQKCIERSDVYVEK